MTFIPGINQPIPPTPFYAAPEVANNQWPMVYSTDGPISVGNGIAFTTDGLTFNPTGVSGGIVTRIIAGENITVSGDGTGEVTISSTGGGGGSGSVTQIDTGTGLTGGPITDTGTVSLADTAVSPGTYTNSTVTVDQQGRLTAASSGAAPVVSVTGTSPVTVSGPATAPVIGVNAASTTQSGAVQLVDSTSSTSVTGALTANQGKVLQTQIDALLTASNLTFAGTFNATLGQVVSVTSDGTSAGFVVGDNLPAAGAGNVNFFVIATTPGSYSPPGGGGPYSVSQGDWLMSTGAAWDWLNVGYSPPTSSTVTQGIVQLNDTVTSTSTSLAGTANSVKTAYDAGVQGQTDAAAAQSTADAAQTDATQALTDAATAQTTADSAQTDATQALSDAASAQAAADTAVSAAESAQTTADTAQTTADSALTTANAAIPKSSFTAKGQLLVATGNGTYAAWGTSPGVNGYVLVADSSVSSVGLAYRQRIPVESFRKSNQQSVSSNNWNFRYNDLAKSLQVMSTTSDNACWTIVNNTRTGVTGSGQQRAFTANTWYSMASGGPLTNQGESQVAHFIATDGSESFRVTLIKGNASGNDNTITLEKLT